MAIKNKPQKAYVYDIPDTHPSGRVDFVPMGSEKSVTGTTFFGREPDMHETLIDYFQAKKKLPVPDGGYHIFFPVASVGCEPFYFAMLAKEKNLLDGDFLTIHASDQQKEFLEYAKIGKYPKQVVKNLEPRLMPHFKLSAEDYRKSDTVQLSEEIIQSVKFEAAGDLRDHCPKQLYDAVVITHVLYHEEISLPVKAELLRAAMAMTRNILVTDHTSFAENKALFELNMMKAGFGVADENLGYKPLTVTRERAWHEKLADALIPWRKPVPVTDIKSCKKANAFVAIKEPQSPSLG